MILKYYLNMHENSQHNYLSCLNIHRRNNLNIFFKHIFLKYKTNFFRFSEINERYSSDFLKRFFSHEVKWGLILK